MAVSRDGIAFYEAVSEVELIGRLARSVALGSDDVGQIKKEATAHIEAIRGLGPKRPILDSFLKEYGLDNAEGVSLMRLAEALIRTPDARTADELIRDRLTDLDWRRHHRASDAALVNGATRGVSVTDSWLRKSSGRGPMDHLGRRVIRGSTRFAMSLMGERFVLGETIEAALRRARKLSDKGMAFSFDMLGEGARTFEAAECYKTAYAKAIDAIAAASNSLPALDAGISIKLSALEPRCVDTHRCDAMARLAPIVAELARAARAGGLQLNIDAEESWRLELMLDVVEAVATLPDLAGWDGFGVVLQAYQRRAMGVVEWLSELAKSRGAPIRVRLVKGAYWDGEVKRAQQLGLRDYPVFTRKPATDLCYLACAKQLLETDGWLLPQFATHNAFSAAAIQHLARPDQPLEFQRLFGMGEALHRRISSATDRVSRIYAPVGAHSDLLAYLIRRLLENGANSSFVNQVLDPSVPAELIARSPLEALAVDDGALAEPRNHLGGRLAAAGLDVETRSGEAAFDSSIRNDRLEAGAELAMATQGDVNEAFQRAVSPAALAWSRQPASARATVLRNLADGLEANSGHFFKLCLEEARKTKADAVAELREAVDFCRYYADRCEAPNMAGRQALGTLVCISPWNFPLAIFLGQVCGALAAGNRVIAKPAPQTPQIAMAAVALAHASGVPEDALQLLRGGSKIGTDLVSDARIAGVCFTGSTATGKRIEAAMVDAGRGDAPLIAETGGLNAMLVDSTALLEQAVDDIKLSAFSSAGQRCSALRLLCVHDEIADCLIDMLKGAMDTLQVGDNARAETDVGPLIDHAAHTRIKDYVVRAKQAGLDVHQGRITASGIADVFPPTLIEISRPGDVDQEVFGPVLHVCRYQGSERDRLIEEINRKGFGLTLGVHSRIDSVAEQTEAQARIGNLYINRNQIGAVVGVQPFGGEGLSGTGPKAGGPLYLRRLSRAAVQSPISEPCDGIWRTRAEALHKAIPIASDLIESCAARFTHLPEHPRELRGPFGERNLYRILPRGVALVLAEDEDAVTESLLMNILAGNPVILGTGEGLVRMAEAQRLAGALTIDNAISIQSVEPATLTDISPDLICLDERAAAIWRGHLVHAFEQIIPLAFVGDDADRFVVERVTSINTAAIGGDVELLSGYKRAEEDMRLSRMQVPDG